MHCMYTWFLATNCSSNIVHWLAVCLFINTYGGFLHLKLKLKTSFSLRWVSKDTSFGNCMTDDDGLRDLQCEQEFVLSGHKGSLSKLEVDCENELYIYICIYIYIYI